MTLFDIIAPLDRFIDHRTYPAAVNAIQRVLTTEGPRAAVRKTRELKETYEDLYLSSMVDAAAGRAERSLIGTGR